MKYIVHISRLLVGVLFIISGLIKLNDPLGFSYKLEEYFSADVLNITFLEPYALAISLFVVIFEVVLGVFLLIGFKPKFTVWSLLGMIVFFTFLTFYSAYFDKVKDCGCFGDALKLTPWESFTKDVILLVFILILFFGIKHIKPLFAKKLSFGLATLSVLFCAWFGYHVLNHLPTKDFRAYKIGANIPDGMIIPEDAPKPVIDYHWKFNVNGNEEVITTRGSYPEVDGELISVDTETVEEGYEPPIFDFSIETEEEDLTQQFMDEEHLVMVVSYSLEKIHEDGAKALKAITDEAIKKGYTVIGLTASGEEAKEQLKSEYDLNFDFYLCDEKALKTVVRSNPGILELQKGTVMQKEHWKDIDDLELIELPNANMSLNFELKKKLDEIFKLDQGVREIYFTQGMDEKGRLAEELGLPVKSDESGYMKLWDSIDKANLTKVEKIFEEFGYPGKKLVGTPTNEAAWYVIQHSPKIAEYLPMIKEAAVNGELDKDLMAMMEDRYLMGRGEEQIYGTQGTQLNSNSDNPIDIIWPIKDPEGVNKRREEAGFKDTVEEYAKRLFGDDHEYKVYTLKEVKNIEKENPWIIGLLKDIN